MKPLRHPLVPAGPGHRSPQTMLLLDERNALLREAADRFCVGMSDRQAAAVLHQALDRYAGGAWQRERTCEVCPSRHAGKLTSLCWHLLKCHGHVVSERSIRRTIRGPRTV
jgi:hypothetical protein